jgi:FAD/FMN-containing dehydrogenase
LEAVEDVLVGLGGRPHWGKRHSQTADCLGPRYPEWDRFQAVRARLDPNGLFTNAYVKRVLGEPGSVAGPARPLT